MADINASFWRLEEALQRKEQAPQATQMAQVNRIAKDGTVYVVFPESDEEVPLAQATSEASVGDALPVEVKGGKLYAISGNASDPTLGAVGVRTITDPIEAAASVAFQRAIDAETDAARAKSAADSAIESAGDAEQAAIAAQNSLKSVVQGATTVEKAVSVMQTALEAVVDYDPDTDTTQEYFWHDANGAHVLGDTSGYRNDIDSTGMTIVDVNTERSAAHFGADGATIGKVYDAQALDNESHMELDYHSMQLIDKANNTFFRVFDDRDTTGVASTIDSFVYTGNGSSSWEVLLSGVPYDGRLGLSINGTAVSASGTYTEVATYAEIASRVKLVIPQQVVSSLSVSYGDILEVLYADAGNKFGMFFGSANEKPGYMSFSRGFNCEATGAYAEANGYMCEASGYGASSSGVGSVASADASVARNLRTIAASENQTAIGKYNVEDANDTYAAIIGNGTADSARSNALAVTWKGAIESGIRAAGAHAWINIMKGEAALFVPKNPNAMNNAVAAITQETAGGGSWTLANYQDEWLRFLYMTPTDRAASSNTVSTILTLTQDGLMGDKNSTLGSTVPVGTILDFAGASVPSGWLECNGAAVSRTTYPRLFSVIGTTWGAGNGTTTFNLPDLGGRVAIGKGSRSVGATGGEETHTLTVDEMPSHTHRGMYSSGTGTKAGMAGVNTNNWYAAGYNEATGGGQAHNNMQPYAVVRKIIKAS